MFTGLGVLRSMSKERLSITIDEDVARELREREEVNVSGLCNQYLQDYVSSGESERAVLEARVERLEEEVADAKDTLERKERRLKRAKEQLKAFDQRQADDLENELQQYNAIPADPKHPEIQRIASDHDMSASDVAARHAEVNDKTLRENDPSDDFKSFK